MGNLMRFLVGQTEASAAALSQRHRLVSGIVVRVDGSQVLVNIGGQSTACQPTLGLPLQSGDQVWVRLSTGQPMVVGVGTRNEGVTGA